MPSWMIRPQSGLVKGTGEVALQQAVALRPRHDFT